MSDHVLTQEIEAERAAYVVPLTHGIDGDSSNRNAGQLRVASCTERIPGRTLRLDVDFRDVRSTTV